jgi:hypothetical protein
LNRIVIAKRISAPINVSFPFVYKGFLQVRSSTNLASQKAPYFNPLRLSAFKNIILQEISKNPGTELEAW